MDWYWTLHSFPALLLTKNHNITSKSENNWSAKLNPVPFPPSPIYDTPACQCIWFVLRNAHWSINTIHCPKPGGSGGAFSWSTAQTVLAKWPPWTSLKSSVLVDNYFPRSPLHVNDLLHLRVVHATFPMASIHLSVSSVLLSIDFVLHASFYYTMPRGALSAWHV